MYWGFSKSVVGRNFPVSEHVVIRDVGGVGMMQGVQNREQRSPELPQLVPVVSVDGPCSANVRAAALDAALGQMLQSCPVPADLWAWAECLVAESEAAAG